ncbi:class I SAM-dependent methyltransferase [Streptomyces sp. BH-SS-21]|uniref:Class I SAM-dependent methyltransferase n=1 Tax=Streptomyces liliiviolaceus TaxID=2823109 RepID=A0A940Y8A5_9ACTN|nr:class I SAM-dependent methyltransferase [Streptomyces liliiviolaceus]MBQ0855081.1 class I SAM-dependent methyltransferase [Streptomyces liliiviolaceus]
MDLLSLARTVKDRVEAPITDALAVAKVVTDPRTPLLLALSTVVVTPLYRAAFLASASGSGVLQCLAVRPCDLDSLVEYLEVPQDRERLRAWLDTGVRLGELDVREGCYRLRSTPAKLLARAGNDAVAAALEEIMRFHVPALLDAPRMLKEGRRFSLGDQDGTVIARSSLALQGMVREAVDRHLERATPVRLLEIGCGTGAYVRHAAGLNPRLTALAVDLQPEVAARAAANMAEWGLTDRVETRQGDLRTLELQPQFDLVTLHNNIYYFPEAERVEVLERARSFLAPGGRLLLTSSCQGGGNAGLDVLNLWFEYADFGGPLPREDELVAQLEKAGFTDVRAAGIVPTQPFRVFVATNGAGSVDGSHGTHVQA